MKMMLLNEFFFNVIQSSHFCGTLLLQPSKACVAEQQDDNATKLSNRRVAVRQSLCQKTVDLPINFCLLLDLHRNGLFLGTLNKLVMSSVTLN